MAVHSNTFGGLRLSGEDAQKFRNQFRYGRPSDVAKATAANGRVLAKAFMKNGSVKIDTTDQ